MKSRSSFRRSIAVCALLVAGGFALLAATTSANQGFVLAMDEMTRKEWDKRLNSTLAEPFVKISCTSGAKLNIPVGVGCVEAGDVNICCKRWTIKSVCGDDQLWHQANIDGGNCEKNPVKAPEQAPVDPPAKTD